MLCLKTIMKKLKCTLPIVIQFLIVLGLTILYFFSNYPDWDQIGQIDLVKNYIEYGDSSWFSSKLWYLNWNYLLEFICYNVCGPNEYAAYLYICFYHFSILFVAFLIINRKMDFKTIGLSFAWVFLMLPDYTFSVLEGEFGVYCRGWWQFTHKEVALLSIVCLYIYVLLKEKNKTLLVHCVGIFIPIILFKLFLPNIQEDLLIVENIILPFATFVFIKYFELLKATFIKYWKYILSVLLLGGLIILILSPMIFVNKADFRGMWFIKCDLNIFKNVNDFGKLMLIYFSGHEIGNGLVGSNPFGVIKILLIIIGLLFVLKNIISVFYKRIKYNDINIIIALSILYNIFIGIITGTGFTYCQIMYYYLGILICRELSELDCFLRLKDERKAYIGRVGYYSIMSVCIFGFFAFSLNNLFTTRSDITKNSNTSTYQMCANFIDYAKQNDLKFGYGEEAIIGLIELLSNGKLDISYIDAIEQNDTVVLKQRFENDLMANLGCNYMNFIIDDEYTNYGHFNSETIENNYNDFVEKTDYFNSLGEKFFSCYLFDYDIRFEPIELFPQNRKLFRNYVIEKAENVDYRKNLDIGTYKVVIKGENLQSLQINSSVDIIYDNFSDSKRCFTFSVYDKTTVEFAFCNEGAAPILIENSLMYVKKAAIDLLDNTKKLRNKEFFLLEYIPPKEKSYLVIQGKDIRKCDINISNVLDYRIVNKGNSLYLIEVESNGISSACISIENQGRNICLIDSVSYEIDINKRSKNVNYNIDFEALPFLGEVIAQDEYLWIMPNSMLYGPYKNIPQGEYYLNIRGEYLDNVIFDISSDFGTVEHEYDVLEINTNEIVIYFEIDNPIEGIEFCFKTKNGQCAKIDTYTLTEICK